jgi:hypothetical protein
MGRSPIYMCGTMGTIVGGYLPELWGASSFSVTSMVFSLAGGFAGVWAGFRLVNS